MEGSGAYTLGTDLLEKDWGIAEPSQWGLFVTGAIGFLSIPMFFYGARCYKSDLDRVHAQKAA